jgi:NADH dehydrogenase [ubiquinone] 1 alpha subcomplex assembly factor 7
MPPFAPSAVRAAVAADIRRHGPIPLDQVLQRALYDRDGGFYESGGRAGRQGDFLTSPEVGPLFGAVVARALDAWWHELGSPNPYVVVEAGAGPGTLARTVLAAAPACAPALRYVLVERSAAQRRLHAQGLPLEDPVLAFAPVDPDTDAPVPEAPEGPICVSLSELPRVTGPSMVLANELLDNLPFGLAEHRSGTWLEVRVDLHTPASGPSPSPALAAGPDRLVERLVPLAPDRAALLDRLVPAPADGARVPLQPAASAWLRDALAVATPRGRVVAIDYATTTADLASRPQSEWLRTYSAHRRGATPLANLGNQDVTCEVAIDQLAQIRPPTSDTAQADWLRHWGIDDLVLAARQTWRAHAHAPNLAAIAARSRVTEADALLDPDGLGRFRVLEWFMI